MTAMNAMRFEGVMPAVTTPFNESGAIDHAFLARHVGWLLDHGVSGIVPLGSLGEAAALEPDEKLAVLETCAGAARGRAPVVAGIGASSTETAVRLARAARDAGCNGLMVLPPWLHRGPWHEVAAHLDAVFGATDLPCMLYNNPAAYGTDVLPERIVELAARHPNLQAVKESSGDVRRVTAVKALAGERLALFAGLDDMVVEAARAGAVGWIAGLVNALPLESVELFGRARAGGDAGADALYRWFLPLLRLDTLPEFVQLIKLVQQEAGMGSERVRPPRRPVRGEVRERVLATVREALATNPLER